MAATKPMSPMIHNLCLTLFVGAAVGDATPAQSSRLRERLAGELEKHREADNTAGIKSAVYEIMGAAWKPTGACAAQLAAFGWPG